MCGLQEEERKECVVCMVSKNEYIFLGRESRDYVAGAGIHAQLEEIFDCASTVPEQTLHRVYDVLFVVPWSVTYTQHTFSHPLLQNLALTHSCTLCCNATAAAMRINPAVFTVAVTRGTIIRVTGKDKNHPHSEKIQSSATRLTRTAVLPDMLLTFVVNPQTLNPKPSDSQSLRGSDSQSQRPSLTDFTTVMVTSIKQEN